MEKTKKFSVRKLFSSQYLTLIIVFVVIVVAFYVMNNNYLSTNNIRNIMNAAILSGMLAIGIACVIISGNPELSAGAVGCIGGVICTLLLQAGIPGVPAVLITIVCGVAMGLINALLVNVFNVMAFIATLAMASVWKGFALILTSGKTISISNKAFFWLGTGTIASIPVPIIILILLFIIYGIILARTRFGRSMYMCGGNRSAARLAGLNPKKISTILFANSSGLAAFAGAILAARMHTGSPTAVIGTEFKGITAAVLGGVAFTGGSGTMLGVFIGLLIMNGFNNGLSVVGLGSYWQICAEGVLLILALLIDYYRTRAKERQMKRIA